MSLPSDVPRLVGAHEIVAVVATGGSARVLRAIAPDGSTVALKRLHPHLWSDTSARERMRAEADALVRAAGPGVVGLRGVIDDGRELCLSLELVRGPSVAALLDAAARGGAPISPDAALRIAAGTLSALEHVHAAGLVHGDISARNVIVPDDGVVLVDFGFAGPPSLGGGALRGTLGYMGPEQVDGTALPASDVFATGVMLWEMLRLERFRPLGDAAARLSAVADVAAGPVDHDRPELTRYRDVVASMLQRRPEARPDAASSLSRVRLLVDEIPLRAR